MQKTTPPGGLTLATGVPAEDFTNAVWPDSLRAILMGRVARSEVPARRYWLRFLNAPETDADRGERGGDSLGGWDSRQAAA
jgi:hypothetical protein